MMAVYDGKDVEQKSISSLLVEVQTYIATLEINIAISQKIGNQFISRPSFTMLGHKLKGCSLMPQGLLFSNVIAAL